MQKITIATLIGIIIIGLGIFLVMKSGKTGNDPLENNQSIETELGENQENTEISSGKKMAFSQFIKQDGAYQCTVNQYIDSAYTATTQGKVFIADGNIRADFKINAQGMQFDTSMITRDGFVYTWTSLANMGYKVKAVETTESNQKIGTSGQFTFDDAMIGDYDCNPWTVESSKFTLPTNITFQEV